MTGANPPQEARYRVDQSYLWNYQHAPPPSDPPPSLAPVPGDWRFCGVPVDSPLGVAAGPLLNGDWCLHYARLGFDVVTYKTVRSQPRDCYPEPNLTFVSTQAMTGREPEVPESEQPTNSWAVSFGMPSQSPDVWQKDVSRTRELLRELAGPMGGASGPSNAPHAGGSGEPQWADRRRRSPLLSVSVVATVGPDGTFEELAEDYARCGRMAVAAGADAVEANFSCPNVSTRDGQLYQQPELAGDAARRLREAVGSTPLVVKVGHLPELDLGERLVEALAPAVDAVAMTNSVASRIRGRDGSLMFDGQPRGICGEACREASLRQVERLRRRVDQQRLSLGIIGVGGVFTAGHVRQYLDAGAEFVQLATAIMLDPRVGLQIREAGI